MSTVNTTKNVSKQTPITYDIQYLLAASEPEDTLYSGRARIGIHTYAITRRRVLRRIRRELRVKS